MDVQSQGDFAGWFVGRFGLDFFLRRDIMHLMSNREITRIEHKRHVEKKVVTNW
jgi:hypothetical protein